MHGSISEQATYPLTLSCFSAGSMMRVWLCRATYREHVEDTFTFDPKTLAILSVTLVAFPTFLYNVMASEYNKSDDRAGR